MKLGEKLLNLRKVKQLSQEDVAYKLDVTRQTVSKWEMDQSIPDLDKIVPLCELYGITPNELLSVDTPEKSDTSVVYSNDNVEDKKVINQKRASGIGMSVLLYFVSVAWIMVSIPFLKLNPIFSSAIFLLICGVATYLVIYTSIVYKSEKSKEEEKKNKLRKQIEEVLSIFFVIIYLIISFYTFAWHITWIIWIVYALICEVIKLVFILRGIEDEK